MKLILFHLHLKCENVSQRCWLRGKVLRWNPGTCHPTFFNRHRLTYSIWISKNIWIWIIFISTMHTYILFVGTVHQFWVPQNYPKLDGMVPPRSACFPQEGSVGLPSWSPANIVEFRRRLLFVHAPFFVGAFWKSMFLVMDILCFKKVQIIICCTYLPVISPTYLANKVKLWVGMPKKQATFTEGVPSPLGQVEFIPLSSCHCPTPFQMNTPPKTNIAPENKFVEKEIPNSSR